MDPGTRKTGKGRDGEDSKRVWGSGPQRLRWGVVGSPGKLLCGNRWLKQELGGGGWGWGFLENCSGCRGRATREQQSPQGLGVTDEAFTVQYLFLFPCMVNY